MSKQLLVGVAVVCFAISAACVYGIAQEVMPVVQVIW